MAFAEIAIFFILFVSCISRNVRAKLSVTITLRQFNMPAALLRHDLGSDRLSARLVFLFRFGKYQEPAMQILFSTSISVALLSLKESVLKIT